MPKVKQCSIRIEMKHTIIRLINLIMPQSTNDCPSLQFVCCLDSKTSVPSNRQIYAIYIQT